MEHNSNKTRGLQRQPSNRLGFWDERHDEICVQRCKRVYHVRTSRAHWPFGASRSSEHILRMKEQRKFVISLLLLALLFTEACSKKKPTLPAQAQAPAPTVAEALPDEIPENPEEPSTVIVQTQTAAPPVKTKPKKPVRTATKKPTPPPITTPAAAPVSTPAPPPASNNQTVASLRPPRNAAGESAPDMAIAAAVPSQTVSKQKEDTAHAVDATENTLKTIRDRSLSDEEKAMLAQIQSYLQQSRKATTDGDYERAYNLANKAKLLADALIKK